MKDLGRGDISREAATAGVPVSVVTANSLFGIPVGDVVLWGTLFYIALQVLVIAPRVKESLGELFSGNSGNRGKPEVSCDREEE